MSTSLSSLRVLVVDDDPVYRRIVTMSLQRLGIAQVEVAADLTIARSKLERDGFDAVTIDVVLRGESGLDLLSWLHRTHKKIATILLTSGSQSQASKAVDALLLGASALILKPNGNDASQQLDKALGDVLRGVQREKDGVISTGAMPARKVPSSQTPQQAQGGRLEARPREVIAIGASTGGPPVLLELLEILPKDFNTPILITQHMPALHVQHFADLLKQRSKRNVKLAGNGEIVAPSTVYVAPGGLHLVIKRTQAGLTLQHDNGPEEHHCKPAVDPMFRSVATVCGHLAVGIVMTGMGADGAIGAAQMHAAGAPILIQDRDSSVVWGMPGAVFAKGVADVVAHPSEIANWIVNLDSGYKQANRRAV